MTPDYRILADSQDVTAAIADRLIELRVTDEAGTDADTVEIRLDDRAPHIALPRRGAELEVSLGYLETGVDRVGLFVVDEVALSGPPDTLTLRARAADLRQGLKSPKTRSWDGVTLADLVATVAGEHGYTPKVADPLAGVELGHVDQTAESDLHLLTRLAGDHGAVAKPAAGTLLFVPAGEAKSASGISLPEVPLQRTDLARWDVTLADRGKYARVVAEWQDVAGGERVQVEVGSGDPVYQLRRVYPDAEAARAAAAARLEAFARGQATLSAECSGDRRLSAEGRVAIAGVRAGVDGTWSLIRVTHVFDGTGGYRCELEAETPKGDA